MRTTQTHTPYQPSKMAGKWVFAIGLLAWAGYSVANTPSWTDYQPAQTPLLSNTSGAKPNLMIAFDNSVFMAEPYHFSYGITSSTKAEPQGWCPGPDLKGRNLLGATKHDDWAGPAGNCAYKILGLWTGITKAPEKRYNPEDDSPWHAQRSADVNPVYYNPRITYLPRVDHEGQPIAPNDGVTFVANNNSVPFLYCYSFRTNSHAISTRGDGLNWIGNSPSCPLLQGHINPHTGGLLDVPRQDEWHGNTNSSTPPFTWAVCDEPTLSGWDPLNWFGRKETGCKWKHLSQIEEIRPGRTTPVTLPTDHRRTDCGQNTSSCTVDKEIANIINWHRYYYNNANSAVSSLGLALSNPQYRGKMRVGYFSFNQKAKDLFADGYIVVGGIRNNHNINRFDRKYIDEVRGVRPYGMRKPSGDNTQAIQDDKDLFNWMYEDVVAGRGLVQPARNAIDEVQKYYQNIHPWAQDPTDANSPKLACRRSFNVVFSNGVDKEAWNEFQFGEFDYGNDGINPSSPTRLPQFNGYKRAGYPANMATRKLYTPFGNHRATSGARTLSDLTAKYYWHTDFQSGIANEVPARPGQPTTWQNMATYTIGYHIRPQGDMSFKNRDTPSGLTMAQIEKYKRDWIKDGASATKPVWPKIGILGALLGVTDERDRVDDYLQAGYTGGGKGFSVHTPEEIYQAFDTILGEITNYTGSEAGTAVSGDASSDGTMVGRVKYNFSYRLSDNSGVLTASKLNTKGEVESKAWTSSDEGLIPKPENRVAYMLESSANMRYAALHNTPLSTLGTLKNLINPYNDLKDETFMSYLLGDDLAPTKLGGIWRSRNEPMAASVNTPPLYIGARVNMGYGRDDSTLPGKDDYVDFFRNKHDLPATLYVGTNAGMVHVFNVADEDQPLISGGQAVEQGRELASYLIRGSMHKLEKYADPHYRFQYLMDGPLVEHDVWDSNDGAGRWKQMIFGTTGRGGKSLFGINSPLNANNRTPGLSDYRWEVAAGDPGYADMAFITNKPQSGITESGQSVLLLNSGHYNKQGKYGLYVVNATTGALIRFIELPSTARSPGVGLGGVTLLRNAKRQIVGAYAGDAGGNMWRFSLSGPATGWHVSNGKPLFTTPTVQPIYAAPAWQAHPGAPSDTCRTGQPGACGTIVVFGTGILLEDAHLGDISTQAIYGIWDNIGVGESDQPYKDHNFTLVEQSIKLDSATEGELGSSSEGNTYYRSTQNMLDWSQHKGWFLPLSKLPNSQGERIIGDLFNYGASVWATSVIINNLNDNGEACVGEPSSPPNVMYGLDALTGGLKRSFDQNGDGKGDDFSLVYLPKGGFTRNTALTETRDASVDLFDPNLKIGVGDPKEGDIELKPNERRKQPATLHGETDNPMKLFDESFLGWHRNWRHILELPETLR